MHPPPRAATTGRVSRPGLRLSPQGHPRRDDLGLGATAHLGPPSSRSDRPLGIASAAARARAGCVLEVTPSLRNALWRWYSTVFGLMKSCAPTSTFDAP